MSGLENSSSQSQEPLVKFDPTEPSAVIRFDIPQPSFYRMKNIFDLGIPDKAWADWLKDALQLTEASTQDPTKKTSMTDVLNKLMSLEAYKDNLKIMQQFKLLKADSEKSDLQRTVSIIGESSDVIIPRELYETFKDIPLINNMKIVKANILLKTLPAETKLKINKTVGEKYTCAIVGMGLIPINRYKPRLAVVEYYRLENFLGNYGTGKTIASFYVHPKSTVSLSIKSWSSSRETYEESSSIFDSYTAKASESFQSSYSQEKSKSSDYSAYAETYANVEADVGICGIGGVDSELSTKGGFSLSRSEFNKTVSNSASQHASERSSSRQMQHDVTTTTQKTEGQEQLLTRQITNFNDGHVLNFLVKELNQEYYSVIVLKDVRLAFVFGPLLDELPLSGIDVILDKYIDPKAQSRYRKFILKECSYIQDFSGSRKSIFEILNFSNDKPTMSTIDESIDNFDSKNHYIRIKGKKEEDKMGIGKKVGGRETGKDIKVEGIPVDVNTITLKTDGVLCCSLLDPGLALDSYSLKKQDESLREDKTQNDLAEIDVALNKLAKNLIENGPEDAASRFVKICDKLIKNKKTDDVEQTP